MKTLLKSVLAIALLTSAGAGAASAQPYDHDRRGPEVHADRHDGPQQRRYDAGRYRAPAGYRAHAWKRGERLPPAYRSRSYVVDYRSYGLRAPPRGYQYVRVNNDVVLTAIATGVVSSVILNLFQ
jgi:Ni/Co efflux regulator RcnB